MSKRIFKYKGIYYFSIIFNFIITFFIVLNIKEEYKYLLEIRTFKNVEMFYFIIVFIFFILNLLSIIFLLFKYEKTIPLIRLNLILMLCFFLFKLTHVNFNTNINVDIEREDFITFIIILFNISLYFFIVEKFKVKINIFESEIDKIGEKNI